MTISPRFFEVVGVGLRRGRGFQDSDGAPGSETVIINERLASQFFPGEDPIGRRIRFVTREPAPNQPTPRGARLSASARRFGTARRGRSN